MCITVSKSIIISYDSYRFLSIDWIVVITICTLTPILDLYGAYFVSNYPHQVEFNNIKFPGLQRKTRTKALLGRKQPCTCNACTSRDYLPDSGSLPSIVIRVRPPSLSLGYARLTCPPKCGKDCCPIYPERTMLLVIALIVAVAHVGLVATLAPYALEFQRTPSNLDIIALRCRNLTTGTLVQVALDSRIRFWVNRTEVRAVGFETDLEMRTDISLQKTEESVTFLLTPELEGHYTCGEVNRGESESILLISKWCCDITCCVQA